MTRIVLSACLLVAPLPAGRAHAQAEEMRGTYTLNPAASDDVNRAIDVAIKSMSFITRPIARRRLRATSPIHPKLILGFNSSSISLKLDDEAPIVAPASGAVIKWKREDGEVFDLSAHWDGPRLEQMFRAADGVRENTYVLGPDGRTLTLHVKLSSPRLPRAVEYNLIYKRSD